jgi:LPXTG-motif cell wall-anchored protein
MRSKNDRKHTGRLLAWSSAAVLVAGSIAFAAPALAAQPATPSAQSAQGQEHKQANQAQHDAAQSHGSTGGSGVRLDKPNDFQAQADPDGMENGGVDQPGGTGGVDTTTQDGNNGSGNDVDCEDDNRGVGIPGHCKDRSGATPHAGEDVPPVTGDLPGGSVPLLGGFVPTLGGTVAGELLQGSSSTTGLTAVTGLDTTVVSAPSSSTGQVEGQVMTRAAQAGPAAGVLPNTGAGQSLLGLAIAALAALALGAGMVRRGRRATAVVAA